ncbi:hypothetical protein NN561_006106 [Cricetulus griseus]
MGLGTGPRYSASSERQGLVSPVQNSRTQSISSSLVSEASDPGQCPKDGDHPYECEFCGSCFRDESTLKNHKRIHTGEKPYECNGCGKKFSLKHQLETHYRVHTGEKPFECKLCHQRSRDYSAMIKHLRTHNGASPYQCTICTEYCPSLSSMQKHMKGHKPEEIPPDWRIEKTYLYLCYV